MSAGRGAKPSLKREGKTKLDDILDFGPEESHAVGHDYADRIRELMKKIRELDARIARLTEENFHR